MVTPRQPVRLDVDGGTAELRDLRALVDLRPAWWAHAACRGEDPRLFFPDPRSSNHDAARAICGRCAVAAQCLAGALARREAYGIWAGTTPAEREAMRRRTTTTTTTTDTDTDEGSTHDHDRHGTGSH
jgi:WhiB family redox-sensing transcriptional regulator